ncbi:finger protein [Colletotrichum sojae]|uniref:Finger protein n=1 Tax=Colletotrichum sojae TaxID=2175907 RepID=A0A8H6J4U6_9PEZI|nr:finger protein [Colletotrichum sojae]
MRTLQAYVIKVSALSFGQAHQADRSRSVSVKPSSAGTTASAWMSMGWAIRLSQTVNRQREPPPGTDALKAHYRRALFWATFMIEPVGSSCISVSAVLQLMLRSRYLAIILGRASAIHERDVTVSLSSVSDDAVSVILEPREEVADRKQQIISSLEEDLQQWLKDTPDFFHPGHDGHSASPGSSFYEVPRILKRQQHTIHLAYHFANMLVYRGYLLREFLERPRHSSRSSMRSKTARRIGKCVDSAVAMVNLACSEFDVDEGMYNGTFWSTSHFIFCALSILLVYLAARPESSVDHRAAAERAVREGMRFHRKLDHGPNANAQRLLDGSQSQIAQSTMAQGNPGSHRGAPMNGAASVGIPSSLGAAADDEPPLFQPTHSQETAS